MVEVCGCGRNSSRLEVVYGDTYKHVTLHSNTIILTTANTHLLESEEMWEEIGDYDIMV